MVVVLCAAAAPVWADAFADYTLSGSFVLPTPTTGGEFDVLGDGRLITVSGAEVLVETAPLSRSFNSVGVLPDADMPDPVYAGPAFVRVSPDGMKVAVGNNGGSSWSNYEVGVFDLTGLTGDWFSARHYDAAWIDGTHLVMSAGGVTGPPSVVTALDTTSDPGSPLNPMLIDNIGGYSGGIAFDAAGNLYTGNGFAAAGPSGTGWIKAFATADWLPAFEGTGPAVDFEVGGTLVADVLSASSLGFDAEGNLHVGGADSTGGDFEYAALIRQVALADALGGGGPVDPLDPQQVCRLDPDPTAGSLYDVVANHVTGELYVRQGNVVYTYVVPEPASAALLALAAALALGRGARR